MKRILALAMALVFLGLSASAVEIDWEALSDDEISAIVSAGESELAKRKSESSGGALLIAEGTVLYDANGVTFTVTGAPRFDSVTGTQYVYFQTLVENRSDSTVNFSFRDCTINDWVGGGFAPVNVPAGKKAQTDCFLFANAGDIESADDITSIVVTLVLSDEKYNTIDKIDGMELALG